MLACEATTLAWMMRPSSMTATPVSSQELSIARMRSDACSLLAFGRRGYGYLSPCAALCRLAPLSAASRCGEGGAQIRRSARDSGADVISSVHMMSASSWLSL